MRAPRIRVIDECRRLRSIAAVTVAAMIVLTACSGSAADTTTTTTTQSGDNNETTTTTTTEGSTTSEPSTTVVPPDVQQELVEAAQAEGEVTWYSGDSENVNTLQAALFEELYGIKVNWIRAPQPDLMQRIVSEVETQTDTADVLTLATLELFIAQPDLFVPLNNEVVPGWDNYPEVGKGPNYALIRDTADTILWNTDLVPEDRVPETWEDILDPFFADQIILIDPSVSPTLMAWARIMMETYGIEFLEGIREQGFTLATGGGSAAVQELAAGAGYITFPGRPVHGVDLIAQGAPIAYQPMPGAGATLNTGIIAAGPHPNAARLFMQFQLSAQGQNVLCANNIPVASFVPTEDCLVLFPDYQYPDYETTAEEQEAILRALGLQQ